MRRLVNHLRGTVRVWVTGQFPERVINLCAQNRVEFWGVEWENEQSVRFSIYHQGLETVRRCAEKVECDLETLDFHGFPEFAKKFRQRYAFLIGLALALCAVSVLSRFILTIEITGNKEVSDAIILQYLQRFGVRPGVYGPGVDRRQIEQEIMLEVKELSWITINLNGTRVEVQVRERQAAPERIDESGYYNIVSETDGIVEKVEPELGDSLVRVGDTVGKGEILISGCVTLEPPQYSELPDRYYYLHARGRVWARTWREITAAIPMQTIVKAYTGTENVVWSVNFFGNRVEIFGNSGIRDGFCDKITSVRQVVLPGEIVLPVWLVQETYRQYEPGTLAVELDAAVSLLESRLKTQMETLTGEDGRVLKVEYKTRIVDEVICVSAVGECMEEIGREVPGQHNM